MLKYKYVLDSRNFSDVEAFQEYLNKMGKKGYELVQWQLIDIGGFMAFNNRLQPVGNVLSILITWKIEDHDS